MNIFSIIEFIAICAYVAYLIYKYARKDTAIYVKILVYISWLLSIGIVFIVPLDVYYVNFFFCYPETKKSKEFIK